MTFVWKKFKNVILLMRTLSHISKLRETDKAQKSYVYTRLKGCFLYVINKREQIIVPTEKQLINELDRIDMSEEDMNQIFINIIK